MTRRSSLQPVDDGLLVGRRRQVVRVDCRRVGRVGASQLDLAAAFRPQLIDDRREPRPRCSPSCGRSALNGEHRAFDVGGRELRPGAREQRRGRGAHRQRAGLERVVLQAGLELLQVALHHVVDGDRQRALELERRRVVVLQALPDAGEIVHDRHAVRRQMRGRADPRQHQQLRRVDRRRRTG